MMNDDESPVPLPFVPVGISGDGGVYTIQHGTYKRIGRIVHINATAAINVVSSPPPLRILPDVDR